MICALSGEVATEPVVSKVSGKVYEKRLIESYLETHDTEPESQDPLSLSDLIPLKVSKVAKPRTLTGTSIPTLLQTFQSEWDALMLETYNLKQQLTNVRQELAHALYQHDAACRVIARLIKERDEARSLLANYQSNSAVAPPVPQGEKMEVESTGISEQIKANLTALSQQLSKERKQRQIPDTLAKAEDIKEYDQEASYPIHKSTEPGVLCLDIHPSKPLVVTGGVDAVVQVFSKNTGKIVASLAEHTQKVTDVQFTAKDLILSSSSDKTAKVWKAAGKEKYSSTSVFTAKHKHEVTGVSVHPSNDYFITGSLDGTWAFHDLNNATTLVSVDAGAPVTAIQHHPDGLLVGTGIRSGPLKIWDLKTQSNAATFEGHNSAIIDIAFSENGYYLATASSDNVVKLWDLRKRKEFLQIADLPSDYNLSAVNWDYSGTYLAIAGADIRVYLGKGGNHITTLTKHTKTVTDVKWGPDAKYLASVSMDKSLKFWSKK